VKSNYWLTLFIIDAVLHLTTTISSIPTLNLITKPLLMILLGGYFVSLVGNKNNKLRLLIIIALACSWFGDTFLMFQESNPMFFMLGLGSFLLAHVAYVIGFNKFDNLVPKSAVYLIVILFATYSLTLANALWSGLGEMKIPVLVYALVITLMGIFGFIKNWQINKLILIGVVLFIISDSLIAYTKFVEPLDMSRLLIMSTYITAQFLIIKGLSQRILTN